MDSFGNLWRVLGRLVARRQPETPDTPAQHGTPHLTRTPAGDPRCVACALCVGACPARCIVVESGPTTAATGLKESTRVAIRFQLDLGRCLLCGLCEAACPVGAIGMTGQPAAASRAVAEDLRLDLEALMMPT